MDETPFQIGYRIGRRDALIGLLAIALAASPVLVLTLLILEVI